MESIYWFILGLLALVGGVFYLCKKLRDKYDVLESCYHTLTDEVRSLEQFRKDLNYDPGPRKSRAVPILYNFPPVISKLRKQMSDLEKSLSDQASYICGQSFTTGGEISVPYVIERLSKRLDSVESCMSIKADLHKLPVKPGENVTRMLTLHSTYVGVPVNDVLERILEELDLSVDLTEQETALVTLSSTNPDTTDVPTPPDVQK